MPRVLYVESGLTGGGSFESLFTLLRALDRDRFRPALFFLNRSKYLDEAARLGLPVRLARDPLYDRERLERHPCRTAWAERLLVGAQLALPPLAVSLDAWAHRAAARDLAAFAREVGADLVHANNQVNRDLYALGTAHKLGLPCVSHLRSFFTFGFSRPKAAFANHCVSRFVAYSPAVAEAWAARGLDRGKIAVVPNAIGEVAARPADFAGLYGIPAGRRVAGLVGKVIPERGHPLLFQAAARAVAQGLDLHLLCVGPASAAARQGLEALARELGLTDRVTLAGPHPEAKQIIAALDVLVLPYTIEPFGRVLLEAWALGTPVVATRVGGIAEMFGHGRDGLLVDPGDDAALAAALAEVLGDAAKRGAMVQSARERCAREYSSAAHAARLEGIYADLLAT